ncbi:MAG: hypothetical protein B7Z37_22455 [Verrucomicrobia bacterium 12-59-8]|nr:MAG: hypothetical protein B7Z37_22455 [Verrucomicrobia bacterium 12-59-8]
MELTTSRSETRRTYARWIGAILVCGMSLVWLLSIHRSRPADERAGQNLVSSTLQVTSQEPAVVKPLVGEGILQGYADARATVRQDLTLVSHLLENFALLVKGDDPLPLGVNEEIAAALRGRNRLQQRFVPDTSPIFNAKGQIVDRWGTPLYFHAISRDRLEIRSAGPDRVMWTPDDVQRQSDGSFLSAEGVQVPSLLEESLQSRGNGRK